MSMKINSKKHSKGSKPAGRKHAGVARPARTRITKDMTLGELVVKHPETVEVMFKYGLHCVGCHMAAHETIEQGAAAHGMDPKAIGKMVTEMNAAAS